MKSLLPMLACLLLVLAGSAPARADRVTLKNGGTLHGRIVKETDLEVVLELEAGMRMTLRRAQIRTIVREEEQPLPKPEPRPEPEPLSEPEPTPLPDPSPPGPTPGGTTPQPPDDPGLADAKPFHDWHHRFARYPTLSVAKLTRFRAYAYVSHTPLALTSDQPKMARYVRDHGHGGHLAIWTLRYEGNLELNFGDEVKFVAELTSPADPNCDLLRLEEGPQPSADRMVMILVKQGTTVRRHFTPTVFTAPVFRQTDLRSLLNQPMPVRTRNGSYRSLQVHWLVPKQTAFLDELRSPFGDSFRVRLQRFRFRVDWLSLPAKDRPPLDPDLVTGNAVRPLAKPGGQAAPDSLVRRIWGDLQTNRKNLAQVSSEATRLLETIGVRPGGDYYVEQDRVGLFGKKGVTIETRRTFFDRSFLAGLLH